MDQTTINIIFVGASFARRFTCANCGEGYHDTFKTPETKGFCDKCGATDFTRRDDDNAETVRSRLGAYHDKTAPLIDFYEAAGKLHRVDAMGDIDDIAARLAAIVRDVSAKETT